MDLHGQPRSGLAGPRRYDATRRWAALAVAAIAILLGGCSGSEISGTGDADAVDDTGELDTSEPTDTAQGDVAEDTGGEDTDTTDTTSDDTVADTTVEDTSVADTTEDTTVEDTTEDTVEDTTVEDTTDEDTAIADTVELDTTPVDTGPPPCHQADDCGWLEAGPCAVATCDDGTCVATPANEGDDCEDGNLCTSGETCASGVCVASAAVQCADTNPCTDDTCDPAVGCVFKNNFAGCDDADPCTSGDFCSGGVCNAGGPACDDGNPCTTDTCQSDGTCENVADDALPCSDGSDCTGGDSCSGGACVPGPEDGCDDGNPCTADSCTDDGLSCVNANDNGALCEDGDACTDSDRCINGSCVPGPAIDCGGSPDCIEWTCDPVTGCELVAIHAGDSCSDLDKCTEGDVCDDQGDCVAAAAKDCDDGNPCTFDSCVAATGCKHQITVGLCDDGDACTTDDRCTIGQCRGTPRACDDGDACTFDSCDPLLGCQFLPGGVDCDDDDPCTDDRCDPDDGCVHSPSFAGCDDGDRCTTGDRCGVNGQCAGEPDDCDDGDPCTADFCDPEEGCHNEPFVGACEDGDPCTEGETCDAGGTCAGGSAVAVDDEVACTVDACDPTLGITHTPDHASCAGGEACDSALGCAAVAPLVLVTRIMLVPGASGDEPGYGQWIVLTNATDAALDLAGWSLTNGDGDTAPLTLPDSGDAPVLPARASIAAVKATTMAPPEGGAAFGLVFGEADDGFAFDAQDAVIVLRDTEADQIDRVAVAVQATEPGPVAGAAFPVITGRALAFDADRLAAATSGTANDVGLGWCLTSASPEDLAPVSCTRAVLNEVRLNGPEQARWIELHLPVGGSAAGLELRVIAPDGQVRAVMSVAGRMPIGGALLFRDAAGLSLPRLAAGAVQLVRDDALVDVYGFGTLGASGDEALGLPLFEGAPGPAQAAGDVAWRRDDGVDTDDGGADWITGPDGSPGELNAAP